MKKIIVLSLLAIMLSGCVNQADYDDLEKENERLKKKIEKLEDEISELKSKPAPTESQSKPSSSVQSTTAKSRFFTVDNDYTQYDNSETGEYITYSLYTDAQQNPMCIVLYSIPYQDNADISYYELKAAWLIAEMEVYFVDTGFENFTISVSTPQGINRDVEYSMLCAVDFGITGKDRNGKESNEPDWFVDTCSYVLNNGYEDEWLFNCIDNMKSSIDSNIHYH